MTLPGRLLWWVPLALLVLLGALLAFRAGWIATSLTETDVINRWAGQYVAETGGALTDCRARPGQGEVWLVVLCGESHAYRVDRRGALVATPAEPEA